MALLQVFAAVRKDLPLNLAICHVHHGLRGKSADLDEELVRNTACHFGFPFYGIRIRASEYTKKHGFSPEEGARVLRHQVLEQMRRRIDYQWIALAHQADDQAETILMNMARGSGIRGLGGIHPKRERIIHPVLFASRKDILAYAEKQGVLFRNDPTNRQRQYRRNQIRKDVMTPLKSIYGSSLIHTFVRSAEGAQEILAFLDSERQKAWHSVFVDQSCTEIVLDIYQFLHYLTSIQKTLIEHAVHILDPNFRGMNSKLFIRLFTLIQSRKSGRWIEINGQVRATLHANHLVFYKVLLPVQHQKVWPDARFELNEINKQLKLKILHQWSPKLINNRDQNKEFIDYEKIHSTLYIRPFEPGDWFVPLGMKGKKKIKEFFIDEKVPSYKRLSVPLLVHGRDIVCVLGYRLDDRYKITPETRKVIQIEITG